MITEALNTLITTNSAFTAIAGTRLYPQLLPNNWVMPACTFQVIASTSDPTLSGAGVQRIRIQFDCFGSDYADATNLRAAIVSILNGYSGTVGSDVVLTSNKISQADFYDHDALLYRAMVEFYVMTPEQ